MATEGLQGGASFDVFVCHAREDKADFVDDLVLALAERGLRVRYDEFKIALGAEFGRRMKFGLLGARCAVVVLSPAFLQADKYWVQDLSELFSLEASDGDKRILPVLYGISGSTLIQSHPFLAARRLADASRGVDAVAAEIEAAVRQLPPLVTERATRVYATRDSVFISYRRTDAGAQAGRLEAELRRRLGDERVFFDTEGVRPGQPFPDRIREALGRARVVLVVIGEGWLKAVDEHGRRRIDDSRDWVRQEVAGALASPGVTLIPVLVDDAEMPPAAALPPEIGRLTELGFLRLEHAQFTSHTEQLVRRLVELGLEEHLALPPIPTSLLRESKAADFSPAPPAGVSGVSQRYWPYPVALVEELEALTRSREDGTPEQKAQRQVRITQLANQLARNPVAGDVVAGARLVFRLGKGNYGTVWHATDVSTGEARAVKVFDTDRLGLGTSLYHFRRGVRAMRHLSGIDGCPTTIVQLHAAEPSDLAFSMDYLEGKDLTHIAERGWAPEKKLTLMLSVCHAVEFAHRNGVIHRDIKPANIVMRGADPVLTDFDIADLLFAKTQSAQAAGTVNYSAPEALAGEGGGPSIDVFSLGRLLHFLLRESDPPLSFEEVPKLADIARRQPALARIIRKCTLLNPSKRYSTVEALRIDLERQVHGSERSFAPLARTAAPRSRRVKVAMVTAGGVTLAALLAGGAALYNGKRSDEPIAAKPAEPVAVKPAQSNDAEQVDPKTGIEFVPIPAGTFLMGSPPGQGAEDEHPQHSVTVSAFELGKYPVTIEQYGRFLYANPDAAEPWGWANRSARRRLPVDGVSWEDAQSYARWAGFRLPTEAEWEYATRAGTATKYWSGDTEADLARAGWFRDNSRGEWHDVGERSPNAFGLYDVHGSVWEWCADWYGRYAETSAADPGGPARGSLRVLRGGSWYEDARFARSAYRTGRAPNERYNLSGFRLARGPRTSK